MYNCQLCNQTSNPGEPLTKVVVETRHKIYRDSNNQPIGEGHEIVKEISVCVRCR